MNSIKKIFNIILITVCVVSCTGSKKYFKAAEKLEKQGLVNEAAEFYMESLERSPKNTDARIKLKQVGQKYVDNLSSGFFREFNTGQYEQSIETFDKLKAFTQKSSSLSVNLNYPQSYQDDYNKSLDLYLNKHYNNALENVNNNKYDLALKDIAKIKKYNPTFKKTRELEITSLCEPIYQVAIKNIENKNYSAARGNLNSIREISAEYKDVAELNLLMEDLLKTSYLIFKPKNSPEKDIEEKLFNSFIELSYKKSDKVSLINNSPFTAMNGSDDLSNAGNTDLIQAVRKATGADFFFVFDVANVKEISTNPTRGSGIAYQKIVTKRDTVFFTEYKSTPYNQVTAQRQYSYDFKYKLINSSTNQVVTSKSENCISIDKIQYNEFTRAVNTNINSFFPYNPLATAPVNQFNPSAWRNNFNARKELRSFVDLKNEADNKAISNFNFVLNNFITK